MAIKVSFALCVTHKMSLIWIRSDWTKAIFLNSVLLTFRDSRIVAFIVFRQNWKYLWQDTFIQKMTDTWFTVSNCKNLWLERGGLEKENILHGARYQFVDGTTPSRTRLTGPRVAEHPSVRWRDWRTDLTFTLLRVRDQFVTRLLAVRKMVTEVWHLLKQNLWYVILSILFTLIKDGKCIQVEEKNFGELNTNILVFFRLNIRHLVN